MVCYRANERGSTRRRRRVTPEFRCSPYSLAPLPRGGPLTSFAHFTTVSAWVARQETTTSPSESPPLRSTQCFVSPKVPPPGRSSPLLEAYPCAHFRSSLPLCLTRSPTSPYLLRPLAGTRFNLLSPSFGGTGISPSRSVSVLDWPSRKNTRG